ncbi:hypothetical protein P8610_18430 [Fictibacillus sp. UD]
MRLSARTSGQVETLRKQSGKWLTVRPAESEAPETEINIFQRQHQKKKSRNNPRS